MDEILYTVGHFLVGVDLCHKSVTLLQVAVSEEDEVKQGAVLVVLEAMKMEHEVKAPKNGKVIKVEVGVGGTVEDGSVLVQMR